MKSDDEKTAKEYKLKRIQGRFRIVKKDFKPSKKELSDNTATPKTVKKSETETPVKSFQRYNQKVKQDNTVAKTDVNMTTSPSTAPTSDDLKLMAAKQRAIALQAQLKQQVVTASMVTEELKDNAKSEQKSNKTDDIINSRYNSNDADKYNTDTPDTFLSDITRTARTESATRDLKVQFSLENGTAGVLNNTPIEQINPLNSPVGNNLANSNSPLGNSVGNNSANSSFDYSKLGGLAKLVKPPEDINRAKTDANQNTGDEMNYKIDEVYKKVSKKTNDYAKKQIKNYANKKLKAAKYNKYNNVKKANDVQRKQQQIKFYVDYQAKKTATQAGATAAKGAAAASAKAAAAKAAAGTAVKAAASPALFGIVGLVAVIMVLVIVIVIIGYILQPVGFTFGKKNTDESMENANEVEVMCMEYLKYKFTIENRIKAINDVFRKAYAEEWTYYWDGDGHLTDVKREQGFIVVKDQFWTLRKHDPADLCHWQSSGNVSLDKDGYTGYCHNLSYPLFSEHLNGDIRTKTDAALGKIINEEDFKFKEFIVYAQASYIKNKYPNDSLEKRSEDFFKIDSDWLERFYNEMIDFDCKMYIYYGWISRLCTEEEFCGDFNLEMECNQKFAENGWSFGGLCPRTGDCLPKENYCCHGHYVACYFVNVKPYYTVLQNLEVSFTPEDTLYIQEMIDERFTVLEDELLDQVSMTYSGTYFDTEETEPFTRKEVIQDWITSTAPPEENPEEVTG